MISVALDRPWLVATLPRAMRVLSWAPHNPGFHRADCIVWREVRNADLPQDFDVEGWFATQMEAAGFAGAVGMLTSRDISSFRDVTVEVESIAAHCVATAGLSNAESVGQRRDWSGAHFGTINLAVAVDAALTEAAQLEALAIAVQARTAAVMEAGVTLPTGLATGTGTDCAALACDPGAGRYAGLHTPVGEAVGAAVKQAVAAAVADWMLWRAAKGRA